MDAFIGVFAAANFGHAVQLGQQFSGFVGYADGDFQGVSLHASQDLLAEFVQPLAGECGDGQRIQFAVGEEFGEGGVVGDVGFVQQGEPGDVTAAEFIEHVFDNFPLGHRVGG